uniref:Putative LOC100571979 [Acyrthosiphon pisum] n=1 Tax=Lepeophtheirus salmonis TaxID=72036 RepID=A0A0K2TRU1_LEPSM
MTYDNFLNLLKPFGQHANPSVQRPVLMVLDNHASHCSKSSIIFCRENQITLLSFLPLCSHEMQPLDNSMYGPFQSCFGDVVQGFC